MRYLCIDLGGKRTGLAVGDDETGVVCPLQVVEAAPGPALLGLLDRVIRDQAPDALVVGLPLNMDGTEGPAAKGARDFARQIADRCGRTIHWQDERLTSDAAEEHLDGSGRTHKQKKQIRDALAAAEILRDFLRRSDEATKRRSDEGQEDSGSHFPRK